MCNVFHLTIVLSVLHRFTDSDYPFGIFKLFFLGQKKSYLLEPCPDIFIPMSDSTKDQEWNLAAYMPMLRISPGASGILTPLPGYRDSC